MSWKVELIPSASKDLKKLDKKIRDQIIEALGELEDMPDPLVALKKLTNSEFYRLRCGDYRIICHVVNEELLILAVLIGHRKQVYSKLGRRIK